MQMQPVASPSPHPRTSVQWRTWLLILMTHKGASRPGAPTLLSPSVAANEHG